MPGPHCHPLLGWVQPRHGLTVAQACIACEHLQRCKKVTARMVAEDDSCVRFSPVHPAETQARLRIVDEYSVYAVLPNPNPRIQPNEEVIPMATRVVMRKLALAAGLLDRNLKTFDMTAEELVELLSEQFPEIEDMSSDEVKALTAELKTQGGDEEEEKPAPKRGARGKKAADEKPAPRRRRRAAKKEEEPEEGEEEESSDEDSEDSAEEEEAPATPTRRGRGRGRGKAAASKAPAKKAPARRGRGRSKAAEEPEEKPESSGGSDVDLSAVTDRLNTIGGEIDGLLKKIAIISKDLKEIGTTVAANDTKLDAISIALTDLYNEGVEEDEQIENVLDLLDDGGK
jgi:hypothetical protein